MNLLDVATRDASARDDRDGARLGDATPFTLCPLLNVSSCAPTETAKPARRSRWSRLTPRRARGSNAFACPCRTRRRRESFASWTRERTRTVPAAILPAPTPRAPLAGPATRQLAFVVELFPFSATTFPNPPRVERDRRRVRRRTRRRTRRRRRPRARRRRRSRVGTIVERGGEKRSPSYSSRSSSPLRLDFFVDGVGPVDVRRDVRAIPFARGRRRFFPERRVRVPSRGTTRGDVGSRSLERRHRRDVRGVRDARVVRRRVGASHDATVGRRFTHAEIEWTVGPVPVDERRRVGSEIVVRYAADLATRGAWATDANGGDMQTRRRDGRERLDALDATEPVAGPRAPVYLRRRGGGRDGGDARGGGSKPRRGFATRRRDRDDGASPGVARRRTGRRRGTQRDAGADVAGAIARGSPRRGTHLLGVVETSENPAAYRALQRDAEYPTVWAFARAKDDASWRATTRVRPVHPRRASERERRRGRSVRRRQDVGFPRNANLLSLEVWREGAECARGNCALVRVAHAFEGEGRPGWDATLSKPVTLDLSALFPGRVVARARDRRRSRDNPRGAPTPGGRRRAVVTLEPMEIKAVVVVFEDR